MTSYRNDRNYELIIGTGNTAVIVKPPIRIVFSCSKSIDGRGPNKMTVNAYNLKKQTRLQLVKDAEDQDTYIPFVLSVGYQERIETIFKGSVHVGYNKFAQPDHITTLTSLDGGFDYLNSFTSKCVRGHQASVISLIQDMPNTEIGKLTAAKTSTRPHVMVGNTVEILASLLDPTETWYIENEQLYIVKDSEVTSRYIPVVSAQTGLLNTPERQNRIVTAETLMNPSIKIGGLCEIKSVTAPHLNAVYKVYSIEYSGDNEGQDWKQKLSLEVKEEYTVL